MHLIFHNLQSKDKSDLILNFYKVRMYNFQIRLLIAKTQVRYLH